VPGRSDHVTDPRLAAALLQARRGQAFWARKLGELRDDEFDGPSARPGWSRRRLVAHVGLRARAAARLVEWARTGVEPPLPESAVAPEAELELATTLPVEALRNLCAHAAVHLNVEWRDLPEEAWTRQVRTEDHRMVPVSDTVGVRTREVWVHAVDLGNGARASDFPPELREDLVAWSASR
jgi:maleylpyruvate isomerase